jgi:hypothetical protein
LKSCFTITIHHQHEDGILVVLLQLINHHSPISAANNQEGPLMKGKEKTIKAPNQEEEPVLDISPGGMVRHKLDLSVFLFVLFVASYVSKIIFDFPSVMATMMCVTNFGILLFFNFQNHLNFDLFL